MAPKPPNPKESVSRPLEPEERAMARRLFSHPMDFPPEFWSGLKGRLEVDPPNFHIGSTVGIEGELFKEVGASGMPVFQQSWVNLDGVRKARFCKDSAGRVHIAGAIKSTVGADLGKAAFTLPAGYLPGYTDATHPLVFAVRSNGAYGEVWIYANGDVVPSIGNIADFFLDGISFRAI